MKKYIDEIVWQLGELQETLKGNFGSFYVKGRDNKGNWYDGTIYTFINDPVIEEVYDIEEI